MINAHPFERSFVPGNRGLGSPRMAGLLDFVQMAIESGVDAYVADQEADAAEERRRAAEAQARATVAAAEAAAAAAAARAGGDSEIIPGVPNWLTLLGGVGLAGGAVYFATK